jgi:hypothetical protein
MNKFDKIINKIIKEKINCFIISPHFDDAALSCGELLSRLKSKTNITIVNVFTQAHSGPYTLSAKKFLLDSGKYKSAKKLFSDRQIEDKNALKSFKAKIINLGLTADVFRKNTKNTLLGKLIPEIDHVYPTYRWHVINKVSPNDPAINNLIKIFQKLNNNKSLYFIPLGVGNHSDHNLVKNISEQIFSHVFYYSDFPYNIRLANYYPEREKYLGYKLDVNLNEKNELLKKYITQYKGLFLGKNMPFHYEMYCTKILK